MKATSILVAALGTGGVVVADFDPPHPCPYYELKVSKLKACSTGREFCRSYLAPKSASFTRTVTSVSTTETVGTLTTSETLPVTVTATLTTTSTSTPTSAACGSPTSEPRKRELLIEDKDRCGIAQNADPSRIEGACNCILASTSTVAITRTVGSTTATVTTKSETTTTSTATMTAEAPPGTCQTEDIIIYIGNGRKFDLTGLDSSKQVAIHSDAYIRWYIDQDRVVRQYPPGTNSSDIVMYGKPAQGFGVPGYGVFYGSPSADSVPVRCYIEKSSDYYLPLTCDVGGLTEVYRCSGKLYFFDTNPPGQTGCIIQVLVVLYNF